MRRTDGNASVFAAGPAPHPPLRNTQVFHLTRNVRIVWKRIEQEIDDEMMVMMLRIIITISLSISSSLHLHVNLDWCDTIKLSNPLHPSVSLDDELKDATFRVKNNSADRILDEEDGRQRVRRGGLSEVPLYEGWWYRGTSLIRNSAPLEPYSMTMPRALWWS